MESPCIWMSAGLVRYKLCDREFDCERCPLDAALRGEPGWPASEHDHVAEVHRALAFPPDRHYAAGHLWVQDRGNGMATIGMDALAAALIGVPRRFTWQDGRARTAVGDVVVALELPYGSLPLAAPVSGGALRRNPALERMPALLADDCYGTGWLFGIERSQASGERLAESSAALGQARLDLRHFRRRAALDLLTDPDSVGATLADGGEALTDLRLMLGPRRYLELVRELVH